MTSEENQTYEYTNRFPRSFLDNKHFMEEFYEALKQRFNAVLEGCGEDFFETKSKKKRVEIFNTLFSSDYNLDHF